MKQFGNKQEMKICSSCGAVYYTAGDVLCPYCGKKSVRKKLYHLQTLSFLLGLAALIGLFFTSFAMLLAGAGIFAGGFVIKRAERFSPLAWFGMTFGILALLMSVFSFGINLYFMIQMIL